MKKFTKIMTTMLCAVLCVFAFVGCASKAEKQMKTEAGITKTGYTECTKEDFATFALSSPNVNADVLKSYRVTYDFKTGDLSVMYQNGIFALNSDGTLNGAAAKTTVNLGIAAGSVMMYYKDGVGYLNTVVGDEEHKYKVTNPDMESSDSNFGKQDIVNVDDIWKMFNAWADQEGTLFKKSVDGDITRFCLSLDKVDYDLVQGAKLDAYIEFDGQNFNGLELVFAKEADLTTDAEEASEAVSLRVAISPFSGKIAYPSFKGYQEVTEDQIQGLFD